MIINLAVRRSLFKHKGLMAAVFILFTIAISLLSLSAYTFDSLEESYIVFDEQRNAEDFRLIAGPFAEAAINDELILEIEEQYNVELEKKEKIRFTAETENVYDINLYEETDELNKQILVEGEYPSKKGDIVLSSQYAELEEIAIGDTYTIDDIDYNVSGIAFFAEYTLPIDLAVGVVQLDPLTYIPLYMHKDSFVDYENTTFYYAALNHSGESNFSIGFDIIENNTIQVPKFDIYGNSIPGDDGLPIMVEEWIFMMSIPAEFNPGITAIEDEIVMDRAVMSTTATGIVILTIILTIILFDTIFQKQKREMGIIKAEGVQATKLAHTFLKYFILILFVGSALGVTIGVMGSGPLTDALLQFYTIPLLNNSREFLATTIGLIAIILFIQIVLIYFFSIRRNTRKNTLTLIKNISKEKESKIRFGFLSKHLNFQMRYRLTFLVKGLPQVLVLAFATISSSFLLLFGALFLTGLTSFTDVLFSETYSYDYIVYSTPFSTHEHDENSILDLGTRVINLDKADDEVPLREGERITLYGFDVSDNEFFHLADEKNNLIEDSAYVDGAVASTAFSNRYNLEVGDKVTVANPVNEDEEHVLVINAIANDPTQSNLFMDIEFFREEFDIKDDFYTGFVGDSQNSTEIKEEDEAATYISVIEMQEMVEENMGAMYTMIGIIVVIATVISLITLLVVGGIVVNNNSKTISILRVLGYRSLEIRKFTTSSYKWVITIVYFGSLNFIEFAINTIISYILSETDFNLNVNIDLKWALIGYFIIMLTYLFSMKMTERKINKVLLSESLKIDE